MCEPRPIFSPQYWRKKIPPNTLHKLTRKRLPGYSSLNLGGSGKERRVLDSAHVSLDVGHFGACWAHAWPIVVPIEAFVGLGQLGRGLLLEEAEGLSILGKNSAIVQVFVEKAQNAS